VPLIIGAAVLAVLIIGGAIFAFATIREGQQNDAYADAILLMNAGDFEQAIAAFEGLGDYKNAQALIGQCEEGIVNRENFAAACALLDAGDYEAALAAFTALGGYKDAAAKAEFCQQNIDFAAAQILFETGDVTGARSVFLALSAAGFEEADGWVNACDYHLADARLAEGGRYDAYEAFTALGGYEDAAAKAESCKLPYPSTGELWHDGAYASGGCAIELNCANASGGHYFKIYSDDKAVATLFINGGESLTCEVVPGYYTIKEATGDAWFGEPDLFGSNGWYTRMTYDDGTDYFSLAWNDIVSITLNTSENGNVGEEVEELEGF
jgi:tetratricopeptide (TPR) repeat protein